MGNPKAFPLENYDDGMDLRDYFAAKAMQALVTLFHDNWQIHRIEILAQQSYIAADAMIKAREEVSNG